MNSLDEFWQGKFGDDYIERNKGNIASNIALFSRILSSAANIKSVIEFGAGIGENLKAIRYLKPDIEISAVEINEQAYNELNSLKNISAYHGSILDLPYLEIGRLFLPKKRDFVLTKGLLIHINPSDLERAYRMIYKTSNKYILIAEYYNPTPIEVEYRGNKGKLWKRDFAGEMLNKYPDLELIDYGFVYHRDNFSQDDITWFLLRKELKSGIR